MTGYTDAFSATVERSDGASVIYLAGELDLASAPDLQACLDEVLASGTEPIIVDVDELSFCDSTGISALVRGVNRARRGGRQLTLRKPRPGIRRVLEITGVTSVIEIAS